MSTNKQTCAEITKLSSTSFAPSPGSPTRRRTRRRRQMKWAEHTVRIVPQHLPESSISKHDSQPTKVPLMWNSDDSESLPSASTSVRLIPQSSVSKHDLTASSTPQRIPTVVSLAPCAPLVIRKRSRHPSQVSTPTSFEAPTPHPDMLAMLQDLESWDSTDPEGALGEHDTPTVDSTMPVSCSHALESLENVDSSTSPVAFPAEEHHNPTRESPVTSLAVGTPLAQRSSGCNSAPTTLVSPPSRMSSFKAFFKRSHSKMTLVPPSGMISFKTFIKRAYPNTMSIPRTHTFGKDKKKFGSW
ncbi:hypothetical protein M405DRAFT_934783 [Rhizopogon salebrosus TDB-379]|nr:hypothetical protein M405DRAFT_934783 [Rhizopogon salebrosus TDB-379]